MGQTIGNFAAASNYRAQASVARSQGRAQQMFFNKRAQNLEAEAVSDSHLAALNAGRMRQNQSAAMGTARAQRGASGLTSEGSGQQAEIAMADVFENAIGDMALSNAISDSNKRYAAEVSRYQGGLAMQQANAAASQYGSLARTATAAGLVQGVGSSLSAGAAMVHNIGIERQIPLTGKNGNPVIGLDGKQMMTENKNWINPLGAWKSVYDLSGSMLQWAPGTVRADRDSLLKAYGLKGAGKSGLDEDSTIYKVFSSLFS